MSQQHDLRGKPLSNDEGEKKPREEEEINITSKDVYKHSHNTHIHPGLNTPSVLSLSLSLSLSQSLYTELWSKMGRVSPSRFRIFKMEHLGLLL